MLMLEFLEGRWFEDAEREHSCNMWHAEVVHFDKEMLQVLLYMEVVLVK